jgi:H+/Cl- antiporter ClcA
MNEYKDKLIRELNNYKEILILLIIGLCTGTIVGLVGTAFYYGIKFATAFRTEHDFIILLLPFAGLFIVFMYRVCRDYEDKGTNLVITSISEGDNLPLKKAPLIFVASVITHLFGGSAGREGAALQIGGSIGYNLGKAARQGDERLKIFTMCGMAAAFSALFGTPMTAAIFAMELESVGIMYYSALVPCVVSALVANGIAQQLGTVPDVFTVSYIPEFTIKTACLAGLLAIMCAAVSIVFCVGMHKTGRLYKRLFKNPYIRIFVGGCIVVALTFIVGNRYYNGAGMNVIEMAIEGTAPSPAFILKILFTCLTLGAGYKGGEIVPSLYIGATFGCLFANIFNLTPALSASIGMGALFCGVTNCPISALLICFEMFGYNGMPYYLIAIALSYASSGYFSLYKSQKIMYSKYHNKYINKQAR